MQLKDHHCNMKDCISCQPVLYNMQQPPFPAYPMVNTINFEQSYFPTTNSSPEPGLFNSGYNVYITPNQYNTAAANFNWNASVSFPVVAPTTPMQNDLHEHLVLLQPGIGTASKRFRAVYTSRQLLEMEKEFRRSQYICRAKRFQMAKALQLTERQLTVWFQNRRQKFKKEQDAKTKGSPSNSLKTEYTSPSRSLSPVSSGGYVPPPAVRTTSQIEQNQIAEPSTSAAGSSNQVYLPTVSSITEENVSPPNYERDYEPFIDFDWVLNNSILS